jgi:hypothetical protein
VDFLDDNPWIHQPFEKYEKLSPSDLQTWSIAVAILVRT